MARPVSVLPGVLAILLGAWTGIGGCLYALGSLGDRGADVPDSPFLSGAQTRAVQELMVATAAYDPVNATLSALSALVGPLLVFAGVLLIARVANAGLVGRVGFGALIAVDALHALWSVAWFVIVWEPMTTYVHAIGKSMPNQPPGFSDSLDDAAGVAIMMTALLIVLYFAVKIALASLGLWRASRLDDVPDRPVAELDPDLGWAE